jgi:hypothetical protein
MFDVRMGLLIKSTGAAVKHLCSEILDFDMLFY